MINQQKIVKRVLDIVSKESGFTPEEILGYSRSNQLSRVRHVFIAVLRELGFSYNECAQFSNRVGHNAAQNSVIVVKENDELRSDMMRILKLVKEENGTSE